MAGNGQSSPCPDSPQSEGPPRDIIAKLHFFRTKEQLLTAICNKETQIFQGYPYQLFQDLSPLTIAERRALRPHLQILQQHHITYRWGIPFAVCFSFQSCDYTCRSPEDLQAEATLQELHLLPPDTPQESSSCRRSTSCSPQKSQNSAQAQDQANSHKWGRFDSPVPQQLGSMD